MVRERNICSRDDGTRVPEEEGQMLVSGRYERRGNFFELHDEFMNDTHNAWLDGDELTIEIVATGSLSGQTARYLARAVKM
jgi:hypothetical protein